MAKREIYFFISDENKKFYHAVQSIDGNYVITKNSQPYPLQFNPDNVIDTELQFATNKEYFGIVRSITTQYNFIKDGAAILRSLYFNGKATQEKCYLTVIKWNGLRNIYELSYSGKFDLTQKIEDPKSGIFSCPVVDDSTWGVLSRFDDVEFSIDCSPTNPKAIPVLIDGITLNNKITYQTVQAPILITLTEFNDYIIPFIIINQDGDSFEIIAKDQSFGNYTNFDLITPMPLVEFLYTARAISNVNITGTFMFEWDNHDQFGEPLPSATIEVSFFTNFGQRRIVFTNGYTVPPFDLIRGKIYNIPFNFNIDLAVGEQVVFLVRMNYFGPGNQHFSITPIVSNTQVSLLTKADAQVVYGIRSLDYAKQLVAKATQNRFTINSNFLEENNKDICLSGDSIRGIQNAKIVSTFKDFFKTFSSIYYMSLRNINGEVWMEQAIEVYKQDSNLIDLGDIIDLKIKPANEYMFNEILVGSPVVDYRHPSGRLEFNSTNRFSLNVLDISNKLDIVSKYRLGCYDIQFLIIDYLGQSTKDNSGDNQAYLVKITDELGYATDNIENFEEVTIDNAILEPIIKSPLNNDQITYTNPVIRGIAPPGSPVNIFADNVLDGGTVSDVNGNWFYELVNPLTPFDDGVSDGIHIIDATYTDELAPKSTITLFISNNTTDLQIIYPPINANLYNNLPLVKGVAQRGTVVNLELDGVLIVTLVADSSCKWEYKFLTPITNGNHVLTVNGGVDTSNFFVDSFTSFPLITYIGSEIDGFIIINNLPLIMGVGVPGTVVTLWLNYIQYVPLGTTVVDANGDWVFQVVPVNYNDPISGIPVIVAPIQNGLNIISTSLTAETVSINVYGYKLSRPAYSSITGVLDNTVFNTEYSPKRMLMSHFPLISSVLKPQPNEFVYFQKADKNGNLRTVLDDTVVQENSNVPVSQLGSPLMLLETGIIRTKSTETFAKTLENFSNGGLVRCTFRGNELFFLPIGGMKIRNITSEVQEWNLVMSPLNSYQTLLNLYKNGLTINIMRNAIHHSDYNTLHFVTYNFIQNPKYNNKELYDDWFNNRNEAWLYNPDYIQKWNIEDLMKDQIINNGLSDIVIDIYRCKDAFLVDTIDYQPVIPAPVSLPYVVMEAEIDWTNYPEDQYFTVLRVGDRNVAISERFEIRENWPGTILIESTNSINKVNFFFSTGIKSVLRVEGLVKKLQPLVDSNVAIEESGDVELLYSLNSRKRVLRFGTAYGLPDYLYLRVADYISLDGLLVEGVGYSLDDGEKINPSDDIDGHPLYYYNVNMRLKENINGKTFAGADDAELNSVVLVVDATAFGLPPESLINIEIDNE